MKNLLLPTPDWCSRMGFISLPALSDHEATDLGRRWLGHCQG